MIKIIDKPTTKIWKGINRIYQLNNNVRYYNFKHPNKYKKSYVKNNHRNLILKKCRCGCQKKTYHIWVTGHNLKLNPLPNNLGKYNRKGCIGKDAGHWKGGSIIVDGYMYRHKPKHPNATQDGYVCEHRLIMEKHLERHLTKEEVVHHRDNNKLNNIIKNLVLTKNQGEHNKYHNRIRDELGRFISGGVTV